MPGERFKRLRLRHWRWRRWGLALLTVLALGILIAVLVEVPRLLYPPLSPAELRQVHDPAQRIQLANARGSVQNQARAALLQGVAGLAVLAAAYVGYRQLQAIRRGQNIERFMRAIEQLGNRQRQLDVALGGIYALGDIARTSPSERGVVSEVLAAYARSHTPWPPRQHGRDGATDLDEVPDLGARAPDVQAALTVLGQVDRNGNDPDRPVAVDLHGCDLRKAFLRGGRLEGVDLHGAHLERADLGDAHLARANLREAKLGQADLAGADLEEADLVGADLADATLNSVQLARAKLIGTWLQGATLRAARLEGASLHRAHLEAASLTAAHLSGAVLTGARLKQAFLTSAHLEGAVLTRAHLEGVGATAAHLEGCGLSAAHLQGGNLTGAHLQDADLSDANLAGAVLKDAHLERANLAGACLEGTNLSGAHLEEVLVDDRTVWPQTNAPEPEPGLENGPVPAPPPVPALPVSQHPSRAGRREGRGSLQL